MKWIERWDKSYTPIQQVAMKTTRPIYWTFKFCLCQLHFISIWIINHYLPQKLENYVQCELKHAKEKLTSRNRLLQNEKSTFRNRSTTEQVSKSREKEWALDEWLPNRVVSLVFRGDNKLLKQLSLKSNFRKKIPREKKRRRKSQQARI